MVLLFKGITPPNQFPLHSRGYPKKGGKIRIGCLTPAFWEAHKWAEMLHHPCILGDPQQRGQNQSKKKNKNKNFPMVSIILPTVLQTDPAGV